MTGIRRFDEVLEFWFSERARALWFEKNDDFDADIRSNFADSQVAAHDGRLDNWAAAPRSAMALILLLDQVPRNIYRNDPKTWASDPKAREVAREVRRRGFDHHFACPRQRAFLYLPFEHSEDMADQDLSVKLYATYGVPNHLQYAEAHRDVIRQFGRFPHRNKVLGRTNTPEEEDYLKDPDAGW